MKRSFFALSLLTLTLVGCGEEVRIGEVELAPSQSGNISPIAKATTHIKNINLLYQDKFQVNTAIMDFEPKGIIPGVHSPLIPLSEKDSQLQSLGFTTNLSNDGEEAQLIYNDSVIRLKVGDKSLYLNENPGIVMVDAPMYNNTTMYIPIIPVLDALKIDYKIEGEDLIIGGMYTDDTGDTRPDTQRTN